MAAAARDLGLVSQFAVAGNRLAGFRKNGVYGIGTPFFNNRHKWKRNVGIKVRAAVQVGSEEGMKSKVYPRVLEGTSGMDVVSEEGLREKGFMGLRKTKLVCTIGPACSSLEDLEKLAFGGMNVARLNMCHGTREWHRDVIRKINKLNEEKGFSVSVMIDTEGSQIHVVDHGAPSSVKVEVSLACVSSISRAFSSN